MRNLVLFSFLCLISISCNDKGSSIEPIEGDVLLAEIKEASLYLSSISTFNFKNLNSEDSISFLKNYTDNWIKNQVLINKAEDKISNLREIEIKAQKYKEDLILASYKKSVIENVDVEITEKDLEEYYVKHKEYFLFDEDYFEIKYIVLPAKTSNLQQIKRALSKNKTSAFIDGYCSSSPGKCHIESGSYKPKSFLKEQLKLPSKFLVTSSKFYYHYMSKDEVLIFNIINKQKKGTLAPIELVNKELKTLCRHNKKQEYLLELEEKTYQKAKNDKNFKNYIN